MEEVLGQKRVEDVSWLCSLSESELDMLISIKRIVLRRARMIGCDELAQKFDLKVVRALEDRTKKPHETKRNRKLKPVNYEIRNCRGREEHSRLRNQ